MTNNYARSDMNDPGSGKFGSIANNKDDENGGNVDPGTGAGQYNNQSWWTTAGTWATSGGATAWDFTTVWDWGSVNGQSLPVLWFE